MKDDSGSALIEFIAIALVLLIPVVYLVMTLARIQSGLLAAEAIAHDAARSVVVSGVRELEQGASTEEALESAERRAAYVVAVTLEDFGFTEDDASVALHCSTSSVCLSPGSNVVVDVELRVELPGVPGFVGAVLPLSVGVKSTARAPVDGLLEDS